MAHYLSVLTYLTAALQRVMSLPTVGDFWTKQYCIAEAARGALIIHVFAEWCGKHQPDPSLIVNNARQNLKSALKPLMVPCEGNPLLLWFLCVGGVGCKVGSPERKWFVGHLAAVCQELGVMGVERLKEVLRTVIWHELQDGERHIELWKEVELLLIE